MGTFYRKADVSSHPTSVFDTAINDVFSDLYDGKSGEAIVAGGGGVRGYLSDFPIAKPPPFGEANLIGLELYTYIHERDYNPPESATAATFKVFKSNVHIGDNEGNMTPHLTFGDSKDNTLTVFSGNLNSTNNINFYDNFSSSGDSASRMVSSTSWTVWGTPYIPLDVAIDNALYHTGWLVEEYWSDTHPTSGEKIVWVKRPSTGEHKTINPGEVIVNWIMGNGYPDIWIPKNYATYLLDMVPTWKNSDISGSLVYKDRSSTVNEVENTISASTSIFNDVYLHHTGQYLDEGGFGIVADLTYSSKNSIDGGTSAKFSTFWHKDLKDQKDTAYWGENECFQRQEVVATAPLLYPSIFHWNRIGGGNKIHDNNTYGNLADAEGLVSPEVSIKFNIDYLEESVNVGADGDIDNYTTDQGMGRGFVITMSDTAPDSTNMSFYDFVSQHTGGTHVSGEKHMAGIAFLKASKDAMKDWEIGDSTNENSGYLPRKADGTRHTFGGEGTVVCYPTTTNKIHTIDGAGWKTWDNHAAIPSATGNVNWSSNFIGTGDGSSQNALMVLPHYHKDTAAGLLGLIAEGTWYNLRLKFSPTRNAVNCQIEDINANEIVYRRVLYHTDGDKLTPKNCLKHITFWLLNYPMGNANAHPDSKEFADDQHTQSTVYVDSITYKNWNLKHQNMTPNYNNLGTRGTFEIQSASGAEDYWFNPIDVTPSYLAVGFESREDFDYSTGPVNTYGTSLFFSGYSNMDPLNNTAIGDDYIRAGITTTSKEESLGNLNATNKDYINSFYGPTNSDKYWSLRLDNSYIDSGKTYCGFDDSGDGKTEKFTQQGVNTLKFQSDLSGTSHTWGGKINGGFYEGVAGCRECKWASARVIEFVDDFTVSVDDPTIFNLPDDTNYILYIDSMSPHRTGSTLTWGTHNETGRQDGDSLRYRGKMKVTKRAGSLITFDGSLRSAESRRTGKIPSSDGNMETGYDHALFISPQKFWVYFQVWPLDSSNDIVPERRYRSVCTINRSKTNPKADDFGATYGESKFTDGPYQNAWFIGPGEKAILEWKTDYGFGEYDVDEGTFGNVQQFTPTIYSKWQNIDLTKIVEKDNPEPGDIITTLIYPTSTIDRNKIKLKTTESTYAIDSNANTARPFMLAKYEDSVPEITKFTVSPSVENPMFPTFEWETDANDLWYGYMIIDDTPIKNKYHRSWNAPFSQPLDSSKHPFAGNAIFGSSDWKQWYSEHSDTNSSGSWYNGIVSDYPNFLQPDGVAGWAFHFDGYEDYVSIADSSIGTLPTSNMSLVMHITPDPGSIVKRYQGDTYPPVEYLFHTGTGIDTTERAFSLWLDTNYRVNVRAFPDTDVYAPNDLTSTTVVPNDGETSTCIIVTFDKTLSHGNLKLFINGKLEDQSGKATETGATGKWKINANLHSETHESEITFAKKGKDSMWHYEGKMEEVSYHDVTIYPVDPASGSFTFDKPISELATTTLASSKSHTARLFVFDYHNIRGRTTNEVGTSSLISFRKATPLIDGRTV